MNDRYLKILCILLFHTMFVYLDDGSGIGRIIQSASLGGLIILLLLKRKFKLIPQFKIVNIFVIAYCIALLFISYFSRSIDVSDLDKLNFGTVKDELRLSSYALGIMISLAVYSAFVLVEYLSTINRTKILFEVFFKTLLFYLLISDCQFLISGMSGNQGYLVGNKFSLSYMHILCYILYERLSEYKRTPNKKIKALLIILVFTFSILTQCTTALLGMLMIVALFKMRLQVGEIVYKLKTYFVILLCGVLFMFFYQYILVLPFVKDFIVDILHEDMTLTGRTGIYDLMTSFLFVNPIWGFGVGNSHWILAYLFGIANAQNGVVNLYIEEGLVGLILYLCIFISIFKYTKQHVPRKCSFPLLSYIVVFFFLGLVEITIDNKLLVIMSFLLAYDNNKIIDSYAPNKYNRTHLQR